MDNEDLVTEKLAVLFGAYGKAGDVNRLGIYSTALKDFPAEVIEKACAKMVLESKFLPAVSEIVDAVKSLMGTADESLRVRSWDEAWGEIEKKMQSTPWGRTPEFSRPEIAAAVSNFGWRDLQATLVEDMPTVRAQMRRMYEDACKRSSEQKLNSYVIGMVQDLLSQGNGRMIECQKKE